MIRPAATLALLAVFSTVPAYADPISERIALMRERGSIVRVLSGVVREQQPFDTAVVLAELEKLNANAQAQDIDRLWPAGTETGGGTESAPAIWEDRAGFRAAIDKYRADVAAAVAAKPSDAASLKAVLDPIAANCSSCHRAFTM